MLDLFKEKPTIVDSKDAVDLNGCSGRVEFRNVHFAYDPRKPALWDVSFVVHPGTKTAIVGESGSGKSTCLKLLYRFYDVSDGAVTIEGHDDTMLFNTSIMNNLLYAKPDASTEDVYQACRAASIHDRIISFPAGYETNVVERGLHLSGGEKQRIAIARALLKNPLIILLDEETASLDSHTEKKIQGALETVTRGRTTITIAHRLSTITMSDHILVMHHGEIVERRTHEELLALNGRYTEMWTKQTKMPEAASLD